MLEHTLEYISLQLSSLVPGLSTLYINKLEKNIHCIAISDPSSWLRSYDESRYCIQHLLSPAILVWYGDFLFQSEKYFYDSLEIYEKHDDKLSASRCWTNIGLIVFYKKQHDECIAIFEKVLKVIKSWWPWV